MRVTHKDPTIYFEIRNNNSIGVMQAGMRMGSLSVFKPSGHVRDTLQAEVSSDKIQNKKAPTDVKRSSTRAKAEKLVDLLWYRNPAEYAERQFNVTNYAFNSIANKSAPVEDRKLNDFVQNIYYNNGFDFLARLMRGQVDAMDKKEMEKYLADFDMIMDQRMERAALENLYVILQTLPPGGPSLYRMILRAKQSNGSPTLDGYTYETRDFPSIDALPDVVQSKLALLQLGSGREAKMVGFQGEADCDLLPRYGFIGEDLGELIDTGRESKEGGGSLSE